MLDLGPAKERPATRERAALLPYLQARLGRWDGAAPTDDWHELTRLKSQVNNARRVGAAWGVEPNDLTLEDWQEVLVLHQYQCTYCDAADQRLTIDHRVPISRKGPNTKENVVPACGPCNTSKGTKTEEEFRIWKAQLTPAPVHQQRRAAGWPLACQRTSAPLTAHQERQIRAWVAEAVRCSGDPRVGLSDRARTQGCPLVPRSRRSQNGGAP